MKRALIRQATDVEERHMRPVPKNPAKKTAQPAAAARRHPTPAKRTPVKIPTAAGSEVRPEPVDAGNSGVEREGGSAPARGTEERVNDSTTIER